MKFRPCIDIHNGKVKQIVGGSLSDHGDTARTNYTAAQSAEWFANKYREDGLRGGHVILLNPSSSPYFEETREQAVRALRAFPKGLQIGGGVCPENAKDYLEAGAGQVIVTSYVFSDGKIRWDKIETLRRAVGREQIVLDLSCRKRDGHYFVVTDRWQKFTDTEVTKELLDRLADYCAEFLIHGVDVEGQAAGIDEELVRLLGSWRKNAQLPVTYAGGIASMKDIELLKEAGEEQIDFTVGSALDLFGGNLSYEELRNMYGGSCL